jgi:hypothetical protein
VTRRKTRETPPIRRITTHYPRRKIKVGICTAKNKQTADYSLVIGLLRLPSNTQVTVAELRARSVKNLPETTILAQYRI